MPAIAPSDSPAGGAIPFRNTEDDATSFWVPATVGLSACITNLVLFNLARRGLQSHLLATCVAALSFAAFIGAIKLAHFLPNRQGSWPRLYALPLAAILFFIALVAANWVPSAVLVILSVLSINLVWRFRAPPFREALVLLFSGGISGFACFLWTNAFGYPSVWAVETALLGVAAKDTLFHADLSAMILHYKSISTGLSGLVPIVYYPGSHAVIGGLAAISKVLPLWQYPEAQQIFLLPCLIFAFAYSACALIRPDPITAATSSLAVLMGTATFDWSSFLASESYCLSLIMMCLSLPAIFWIMQRRVGMGFNIALIEFCWMGTISLVLIFVKTSVAIVICTMFIFSFASYFVRKSIYLRILFYGLLPVAAITAVYWTAIITSYPLKLFDFPTNFPEEFWGNVTVALCGLLACMSPNALRNDTSRANVALTLASTAVISFIPGNTVDIAGGSAYYFQHPLVLIACLPIAGWAGSLIQKFCAAFTPARIAPAVITLAMLALLLGGLRPDGMSISTLVYRAEMIHSGQLNAEIYYSPESPELGYKWLPHAPVIFNSFDNKVTSAIYSSYISHVIDRFSSYKAGRNALLYIPPSTTNYWSLHPDCSAEPFLLPALLGVPAVVGLPPANNNCKLSNYGFERYNPSDHSRVLDRDELCRRARHSGFSSIIPIANSPEFALAPIDCK